jgi:hypothetical protein
LYKPGWGRNELEQWINQVGPELIRSFSLLGYGLVFLAGIVTSITPCNVSMIPIIIAHVSSLKAGRREGFALSVFFTLGTATTFMLLGLVIANIGGIFGTSQSLIYYFVAGICTVIALNLLGLIPLNFSFGYGLTDKVGSRKGPVGSYILGLVMGLAGSMKALNARLSSSPVKTVIGLLAELFRSIPASAFPHLERMDLAKPSTIKERIYRKLVVLALRENNCL